MPIVYIRGFQHFGTHLHPNQNCTALRTPISELYPLGIAPNKKCYSNKLVFWGIFKIWCTPVSFSRSPRGTHTPGWEPLVYIKQNNQMITKWKTQMIAMSLKQNGFIQPWKTSKAWWKEQLSLTVYIKEMSKTAVVLTSDIKGLLMLMFSMKSGNLLIKKMIPIRV